MSDVTIADFIAWEPRLVTERGRPAEGQVVPPGLVEPLAWIVAARMGVPMLPALRGGEAVLLTERLLASLGGPLEGLLSELARSGVAAAIVPDDCPAPRLPGAAPLELLRADTSAGAAELESDLNRSLTELRGDLYRAGTELSREISRVAAAGGGAEALLEASASTLDMRLSLGPRSEDVGERWDSLSLVVAPALAVTATVADPRRRALARLALRALQAPLSEALLRDEAARPRGQARAAAIGRLLDRESAAPAEALARSLGLDLAGRYRVALAVGIDPAAVARALGQGEDAGSSDGLARVLIRADDDPLAPGRQSAALARLDRAAGEQAAIAISAAVDGVTGLPEARDVAAFIAGLQRRGLLATRVAAFDAVDRIGPFRVVHAALRDPALVRFATEALGGLPGEDRRRTLRDTLLAFLDAGGSQALTAERLGIHRNTLAYRLRRISELAGRDPTDPANRLTLHVAALIDAVGSDTDPRV